MEPTGRMCANCGKEIFDFGQLQDDELLAFFKVSTKLRVAKDLVDRQFDESISKEILDSYLKGALSNLTEVEGEMVEIQQMIFHNHEAPVDNTFIYSENEKYYVNHCGED